MGMCRREKARRLLAAQAEVSRIKCTFTGNLPHQAVLTWLSQARVFCAPSVTAADGDAEALGMVFAEAQALGVPVVSSLHGGIPEVVQHGITGLLAPERDVPRLAEYLLRFLEDDLFWESCSKAGILWVRERFDIEVQTAKLEQIYTSCLEKDNK
jgi:colanic acid/amylovoran biosynthesis glycosyltransferase